MKMKTPCHHPNPRGQRLVRRAWRVVGWLGLALGAWLPTAQATQEVEEGKKEEKKIVLREPEQKALAGFIERLMSNKRRLYEEGMVERVKEIVEVTGADAAVAEQLEKGFEPAVAATMVGWDAKAYDWLAPFVGRSTNALREMARWPVEQIAKSPGVKDVTSPDDQPVWREHVKASLTAEQWQKWEEKLAEDARQLDVKVVEYVKFAAENQRPNVESELELVVEEIQNTLNLPSERGEALKELTSRTVDETLAAWQVKAEKLVREMDRERREQVLSQGSGIGMAEESGPQRQQIWEEGLAKLLTESERTQLETARAARLTRRLAASRGALLLLLDEYAALSVDQRQALEPLMQAPAEKLTEQMKRYYNLEPYSVGAVLRDCDLEPLKARMEEAQWQGVEKLLSPRSRYQPDEDAMELARNAPVPDSPEAIERMLTADLMARHQEAQQERLAEMALRIAEVDRTVRLQPAQREALELAALGAAQDSLQLQRTQLSTWLRQSLAGTPPAGLPQRLATLGTAGFGQELAPFETALWLDALDRQLTPEQQQRWAAAQLERRSFLRLTQRQLVLSELDHQLALTAEQVAFFDQRLAQLLAEYAEDLDEYNGSRRWHLQAYSMLTPVAGIPEKELKAQLSEAQMTLWLERSASQVKHYWEGVKRKHDARIKDAGTQEKKGGAAS